MLLGLAVLELGERPMLVLKHKDTQAKVDNVRKQHKKVEAQVEEKGEGSSKQANKGRKKVIFDPGGGV